MSDAGYERAQEDVQEDITGYLVCDSRGLEEFFLHAEVMCPKDVFQRLLNEWLETTEGKAFFERAVSSLMDREPEREDEPGSER